MVSFGRSRKPRFCHLAGGTAATSLRGSFRPAPPLLRGTTRGTIQSPEFILSRTRSACPLPMNGPRARAGNIVGFVLHISPTCSAKASNSHTPLSSRRRAAHPAQARCGHPRCPSASAAANGCRGGARLHVPFDPSKGRGRGHQCQHRHLRRCPSSAWPAHRSEPDR